jgi:integrase
MIANGYTAIDAKSVAAYVRSCRNMALSSQQNMINALKAFGTWMMKQGLKNPMKDLVRPKGSSLPDVLEPTEVEQLLLALETEPCRERAIVYLLLDTGLRVSELAALERRDLDLYDCKLRVRKGKGNNDRVVYFSPTTAHIVAEYLETHQNPHVFMGQRIAHPPAPLTPNGIGQALRRLAKRHGFERLNPPLFRHTCGTDLAAVNVGGSAIATHLGHKSVSTTTKIYISLANERQRNIIRQASPVEQHLGLAVPDWPRA